MKVDIMTVTPALAREWLTMNTGNRNLRRTVVERYRADMEQGRWQLNGEAVVLNGDRVLDGQHRLMACIEANTAFETVVVSDAPESVMTTIDQGVSRNLADVLKWRGHTDQNHLASVIRTGWRWDNGALLRPVTPSINQALEWLDANERAVSAARFAKRFVAAPLKLRGSVGGPVYLKALESDEEAATEFFDRLLDGEHLAHGQPLYALRRLLITNATRHHGKMGATQMMALVIKAWNLWVTGEPAEVIVWRRGSRGERFPVMLDIDGNPISAEQ